MAAMPVADAEAPTAGNADAGASHHMANCPTAVTGAEVAIKDVEGGVEVTVTGKDDGAMRDIRERTKKLADADKNDAGAAHKHDDTKDGVVVSITVIGSADKTDEIRTRAKHTATVAKKSNATTLQHSGDGTGSGGVGRCPIVVEGDTKVELKDVPNGVEATVTKDRAANFVKK